MKTIQFQMIACDCGACFSEHELIKVGTEDTHTISDWACPHCGGFDYDEVDE